MNELIIDLKRTEIEAARPNPVGRAWSADELNRLEAEVVLGLVFSGYNALERARSKNRGSKKARRSAAPVAGK